MSDPFGAIHNQAPGDVGVYIGNGQWAPASQGSPVVTTWRAPQADPDASQIFTTTHANVVEFVEGSASHPVTDQQTATVMISRTAAMLHGQTTAGFTVTFTNGSASISATAHGLVVNDPLSFTTTGSLPTNFATATQYYVVHVLTANTFNVSASRGGTPIIAGSAGTGTQTLFPSRLDSNAALWVTEKTNGLVQGVAIQGYAENAGPGDTVGLYTRSIASGTGNAIGTFTIAQTLTGAPGIAGNNVLIANTSGINYNYASSGAVSAAVAIQSLGDNSLTAGVGVGIFGTPGNSSQFDVGYAIHPSMVKTTSFLDESSSTISIDISGGHAGGNIRITENDDTHYMQVWRRTTGVTGTFGLLMDSTAANLRIDEVGVAIKAVIAPGTPGANHTCLFIQEGAGPTLRQVDTFDPGTGGSNFTSGMLVLVAT